MKTLTKSLHTVTAVKNVARYILATHKGPRPIAVQLANAALDVLGYPDAIKHRHTDETVQRCISACADVLAGE
jgi:hypothetical protein